MCVLPTTCKSDFSSTPQNSVDNGRINQHDLLDQKKVKWACHSRRPGVGRGEAG